MDGSVLAFPKCTVGSVWTHLNGTYGSVWSHLRISTQSAPTRFPQSGNYSVTQLLFKKSNVTFYLKYNDIAPSSTGLPCLVFMESSRQIFCVFLRPIDLCHRSSDRAELTIDESSGKVEYFSNPSGSQSLYSRGKSFCMTSPCFVEFIEALKYLSSVCSRTDLFLA